ncbi:MAG TPA: HupE/UreJ family protein [Xanthobacteraceae bacterium]|nr:HupE/UreJ family protein [Xanthobacteraceae bacterium]
MIARIGIAVVFLFASDAALAHAPFSGAGGFYGGLLHPWFVPVHLMAIVATAAVIAQQGSPWNWSMHWHAPAAFAIGLAAGFIAIACAYAPEFSGEAVLAVAAMAGLLTALALPLRAILVATIATASGAAVALDSPPDVISLREAIVIQLGTFCGAILLMAAALEGASRLHRGWQRIGIRILGSWIAASAVLVLALQLAQ